MQSCWVGGGNTFLGITSKIPSRFSWQKRAGKDPLVVLTVRKEELTIVNCAQSILRDTPTLQGEMTLPETYPTLKKGTFPSSTPL